MKSLIKIFYNDSYIKITHKVKSKIMIREEIIEIEEDLNIDDVDINKDIEKGDNIDNPFSTKDIKITSKIEIVSNIVTRLEFGEIDLNPDFQRNDSLWNKEKMSRLIESILLKLPLPVFYFDVSNVEKWIVVDGLQRLSTIKKFMVDKKLTLKNLEFLQNLNGKNYDDLDRSLQRIIRETEFVTYQIEAQTPKEVRYSIFNRINTGGLNLNSQEIRQALNQKGKSVKFLKNICENDIFKKIVAISPKRMLDRELALRFIAFKLIDNETKYSDMQNLLDKSMEKLDNIEDNEKLKNIKNELFDSLEFSEQVIGKNHRFSRSIAIDKNTKTLNRSLFDVITVCFSEIKNKDLFLQNKDLFLNEFKELLQDEKSDFSRAITEGTSSKNAIETRFKIIRTLIQKVLNGNN